MTKKEKISGNLVDLHSETIYPAEIEIENGRIAAIHRKEGKEQGYLLPGFVDAHIHIESSMLPPSEFARIALCHGTVATVSDPHEIGNVLGTAGVEYMLENGSLVPFKFYFGAPPCVPATDFETAGARIGPDEIRYLLKKKEIKYLSEVMNFPGVIHRDPDMVAKLAVARELNKRIDGHAPGVRGEDLKKYISAGIETDHECTSLDEAREKMAKGLKILIREGSAARDFDALFPLMIDHPERCMLCSDDLDPHSLVQGNINLLVKRAIAKGLDVMKALRCASKNAIDHYGLEVGQLRVGDPADFIQVHDLKAFQILSAYVNGHCVMKDQKPLFPRVIPKIVNKFAAKKKKASDFHTPAKTGRIKVIEAADGLLITRQIEADPRIAHGFAVSDPSRDILKIAVVNRYADTAPSIGFIKNFGLKKGAIASSIAHDSHNIIAVGATDEALCKAVNCVIETRGGIAAVDDHFEESLPLPIAGLMSDKEGHWVASQLQKLEKTAKGLGSPLVSPFMTLSFMALLVIPSLKMSDKGLFDVNKFAFTDLWE